MCSLCSEIGRKEREEREVFRQLQEQGYKVKQEYIQQGKRTKDEKRVRHHAERKRIKSTCYSASNVCDDVVC